MEGRQSPGEVLQALFSHLEAAERPDFATLPTAAYAFLGALSALHALGLVSASEHQEWQRRADVEMKRLTDPERVPKLTDLMPPGSRSWEAPEAKQAGLSLLREITGDLRRTRAALLAAGLPSADIGGRGYGAVEALHQVGLLDEEERLEWNNRVAAVLTEGMPNATRITEASLAPDTAVSARFGPVSGERRPPPPRIHPRRTFSGSGPRKLLSVVGGGRSPDDPRLEHVELFEDGVVVTWTHARYSRDGLPDQPRVRLHDDAGTEYLMHSGGGGSFGDVVRSQQVFVPAVPVAAGMLEVQIEEEAWRLPLEAEPRD